jgi:hypothetical protein
LGVSCGNAHKRGHSNGCIAKIKVKEREEPNGVGSVVRIVISGVSISVEHEVTGKEEEGGKGRYATIKNNCNRAQP